MGSYNLNLFRNSLAERRERRGEIREEEEEEGTYFPSGECDGGGDDEEEEEEEWRVNARLDASILSAGLSTPSVHALSPIPKRERGGGKYEGARTNPNLVIVRFAIVTRGFRPLSNSLRVPDTPLIKYL